MKFQNNQIDQKEHQETGKKHHIYFNFFLKFKKLEVFLQVNGTKLEMDLIYEDCELTSLVRSSGFIKKSANW